MNELSMKKDKNLPNLKVPVKGKKGVSKFMRKKAIGQMKDAVHSADRKPEKYIKPDGKVGIRMVKVDKEIIKKESIDNHPKVKAARKAHAAGTWDGNVDKEGEAVVHINGKPHTVTNRYSKKKKNEAIDFNRMRFQAAASQKKNQKKTDDKEKKKMAAKADMDMRARKESVDEAVKNLSAADQVKAALKIIRDKRFNMKSQIDKKTAIQKISKDLLKDPKVKKEMDKIYEENVEEAIKHTHAVVDPAGKVAGMTSNERDAKDIARRHKGKVIKLKKPMSPNRGDMMINRPFKEEIEVDEALNLQQRMKRSRLMKRMKSRIKIGKQRAMRKMANKKTLEKRAMRQARGQIAKKLTRGIPKSELTFARKQEIEKRLDKPALKARIKRIAKRIFKDVRKKEVQRKKG